MKKIIQFLLVFGLTITNVYAKSNRTFLMPRPHIVNLATEYTTWHDHIFNFENKKNKSHLQLTPFFQATTQGSDIGEYFGIGNGKNYLKVGTPAAGIDLNNRYLIHNQAGASNLAGTVKLTPKQRSAGIRIDFFQFLNSPLKNTFFKLSTPIVYIQNDINFEVGNSIADANGNTLLNFFKGNSITQPLAANKQNPLTHAKLSGKVQDTFGVADIDIAYGYRLIEQEKKHLYLHAGITIPTGTRIRGKYLFEPFYGNGHHFGLGCGVDASFRLWKKERHSGKIIFALNHKYLFEGSETRTIPLNKLTYPWAHYYLVGKQGDTIDTPLTPAANVLTRDVSVRPGNQLDAIVMFNFKNSNFLIDLGYNLFTKEAESVWLKSSWLDDTYAIAAIDYDVSHGDSHPFNVNNALHTVENGKINNADLNVTGAATPSQLTHKCFGGLGYKFNILRSPSSFGLGAHYEFANSNNEFENYAFWGKFAISF